MNIVNKSLKIKLNSSSGLSILVALMGLLLASVISTVLINAALTNAERATRTREQNQAYLTVESAMKMTKGMLQGCKVTFDCTETTYSYNILGEGASATERLPSWTGPQHIKFYGPNGNEPATTDQILNKITEGVLTCISGKVYKVDSDYIIGITLGEGEAEQKNVNLTLKQDYFCDFSKSDTSPYNFDLDIRAGLADPDYPNAMKMKAEGKCELLRSKIVQGTFQTSETDTEGKPLKEECEITETFYYEITWDNFLITKDTEKNETE